LSALRRHVLANSFKTSNAVIVAWPHLLELYEAAVRGGLKSNPLVLKELQFLSELHKLHYARYPQVESKPVPARISKYNKMLDHFFGDIENALGDASRIRA
jgi:hypothetical protein